METVLLVLFVNCLIKKEQLTRVFSWIADPELQSEVTKEHFEKTSCCGSWTCLKQFYYITTMPFWLGITWSILGVILLKSVSFHCKSLSSYTSNLILSSTSTSQNTNWSLHWPLLLVGWGCWHSPNLHHNYKDMQQKKQSISAMFTLHTQEFWKILSFPRIDIFENTTKKLSYHSTEKKTTPKLSFVSSYIFLFATQHVDVFRWILRSRDLSGRPTCQSYHRPLEWTISKWQLKQIRYDIPIYWLVHRNLYNGL